MGIDHGGAGQGEKDHDRLDMPPDIPVAHGPEIDISPGMDKIENIGGRPGKDRDGTVNDIVGFLVDQGEHQDQGQEFDRDLPDRDIGIVLQSLIQPFHTDKGQEGIGAHDHIKELLPLQTRHSGQQDKEGRIGNGRGHQAQDEQFLDRPAQLFLVIPDAGHGPDAVGGHAQLGEHGEIGNEGGRELDLARSFRQQDPGDVGECDQRENERRHGQHRVHDEIELQ